MIAACPATVVQTATLPGTPSSLAHVPWVSASAGIAGVLFAPDRTAKSLVLPVDGKWRDGRAAKVLWWMRRAGAGRVVVIRGTSLHGGGTFEQRFPSASSGGGYPSIVDIPSAGCWRLTVSSGALRGALVVRAVAR